ncbi:MAG: TolC family protein, partial [Desulfocapsaceae bacterium]|nr:TolC family protein [Desulfocapsaceae bacterium]
MLKRVVLVVIISIFASNSNAADLLTSWRAARAYDASFLGAGKALAAGLEKSKQGDSMILPQVVLTANMDQTKKNVHPGDPLTTSTNEHGLQYGSAISLAQPIYNASAFAIRDELNIQAEEAQVQYRIAEQDLMLRVAKAYFEVLLSQKNVDLVKAQMDAVSQQLAQAKNRSRLARRLLPIRMRRKLVSMLLLPAKFQREKISSSSRQVTGN